MVKLLRLTGLVLLFSLFTFGAHAQTYWTQGTGTTNWNGTSSWSTASCGGAQAASTPTTTAHNVNICTTGKTVTGNVASSFGALTITAGTLNLTSNISVTSLTMSGGTLSGSGTISVTGNVSITGGTVTGTTIILTGTAQNIASSVTIPNLNISGTGTKTMTGNVTVTNLDFLSNASARVLAVAGNTLTATNIANATSVHGITLASSTPYSSLVFGGTAITDLGTMLTNASGYNLNALTVGTGNVALGAKSAIINGLLTMGTGDLTIGSNTLTLNGTVTGFASGAVLVGSATSNLTIGGTGAMGTINFSQFSTAEQSFLNIIVNRASSGTVTFASAHRVVTGGTLQLLNGTITNSTNTTLAGIVTITRVLGSLVSAPNTWATTNHYIYGDGTTAGNITTGVELTTSATIGNFTVNVPTANAVLLNASPSTVSGVLTITLGDLAINGQTLALSGTTSIANATNALRGSSTSDMNITGTGTLGTLYFDQATPGTTNLLDTYTQNRTSTGIINLGSDLNIGGSFTFGSTGGLFQLGTSDITFGTTATVGGSPTSGKMIVTNGTGECKKIFTTGNPLIFTFPVGEITGTAEIAAWSMDFSANSIQRTIGIRVTDGIHPSLNTGGTPSDYITRYWTFTDDQAGTMTYTGTADYNGSTGDIVGSETNMLGSAWNGTAWVQPTNFSVDGTNNTIDYTSATQNLNGLDIMGRAANPPANDNVCGATNVTPGAAGAGCTNIVTSSVAAATQTFPGCTGTANDDVWFKFTATATSHTVYVAPAGSFDLVIQAYYNAACASVVSGSSIGSCIDGGSSGDEELVLTGLTVGFTYFVRVYDYNTGYPSNPSFDICIKTPPANDDPCGAVTLTPNAAGSTTCSSPVTADAAMATETYTPCGFSGADDIWFKFVATASSHTVEVDGSASYDAVVQAYTATNCSTAVAAIASTCTDVTFTGGIESLQLTGLTVGTTYYVRVYHAGSSVPSTTTFTICIKTAPANDVPCGAVSLTPNAAGSTTCASPVTGDVSLASQSFSPCGFSGARDVWYSFAATATSHTVEVDGAASFDAVIQAYTATNCSTAVTAIASTCTDVTFTNGIETLQLTNLTVGTVYYIRVYHAASNTTVPSTPTFTICVKTAPANDVPCGAVTLTPGPAGVTTCTTSSTGDVTLASQTFAPCGFSGARDVWYKFTATATSHIVEADGAASFDAVLQAYTATNCSTAVTAISSTCTDVTFTGGIETLTLNSLTVGVTYYVRVYHAASNTTVPSTPTFTICVKTPPPPPVNDNCAAPTSLTHGATCGTPTGGTTVGATGTLGLFTGDDDDVWYTFAATATGAVIEVTGTGGFDAVVNLRDNSACNSTNIIYHDFTGTNGVERIRVTGLTVGQTYRVRVFSAGTTSAAQGTFTICVYTYTATGNDQVANATTASVGTTTGVSNASQGLQITSNTSGVISIEPTGLNWFPFPYSAVNSQWFKFTPATNGCYTFASTFAGGPSFDTELAIYTASNIANFNTYVEVDSDEDGGTAQGYGQYSSYIPNLTLTGGTTYYIQVTGFPYTNGTPALTIINNAAPAPVATAATSPGCTGFTANWNASTNAASYVIDVATDAAFTSIVPAYNNLNVSNVLTYNVSGLTAGTNFYYRVRAVSVCNVTSANSNVINVDVIPTQPGAFTTSSATVCQGQSGVVYTIPNVSGVTYNWTYNATGGTVNGTGNSVTVDFATNAQSGTLSVTATGCSSTSAPRSIAVTVNPLPNTPVATGGSGATTNQITANWNSTANATSYILEVSTVSNFTTTVFNSNVGNVFSYTVGGLIDNTTYYYRVTGVNSCGNGAVSNTITYATIPGIGTALTWDGSTSTNWNDITNWTPQQIPTLVDDITIPDVTNDPALSTGANGTAKKVTMQFGATLTIASGYTLDVKGDLVTAGNVISGAGKLILSGTSAQSITAPMNITNLQLNNSAGASIIFGVITVQNALELKAGALTTNSRIILNSNASGTAYIDNFTSGFGGTITGNITQYRYNTGLGWHILSMPTNNTPITEISEVTLTGQDMGQVIPLSNCNPSATAPNSPYGNVMEWHEDGPWLVPGCKQSGWFVRSAGTLLNARGYLTRLAPNQILSVTGQPNLTDQYYVNLLDNTNATGDGWHMQGNPFPSIMAWTGVAGFGDLNLYNSSTGVYQPYAPVQQKQITNMQGFMVRRLSAGAVSFILDNSMRRTGSAVSYVSNENWYDHLLEIDITGNGFADHSTVYFNSNATAGYEPHYDARKLDGRTDQPAIYTHLPNGTEKMGVNGLGNLTETQVVPMVMTPGQNGTYTLTFNEVATFPQSAMVYLEDLKEGTLTDLRANNTYTFSSDVNDNPERFLIRFNPPVQATITDQSCEANGSIELVQNGSTVWESYNVKDNNGNQYAQGTDFTGSVTINNLTPQEYIVNLVHASGYATQEFFTVNGINALNTALTASANNVQVNQMVTLTATANNADAYTWNFGDGSTAIGSTTVQHSYTTAGTYNVTVTAANADCQSAATQTFNVGKTTSVTGNKAEVITINGMGNHLVVEFNNWGGDKADIFMYNALGQRVESFTGVSTLKGRHEIITNVIPGTYFIQVVSNGKTHGKKVYLGGN